MFSVPDGGGEERKYQLVYIPILTYGHELCVVTERIRLRIRYKQWKLVSSTGWPVFTLHDRMRNL